ncbi:MULTISPECIES: ABC transporter ATP-binding protein [Brucella/Ochrobactrum group]|jgi:iron complex transport system ATP-binding protein|uniref:ABC transporter ATP-binding protein n=1 Tax=Brucella/Ochrobactrum group TaxID=2826938 RepID=UPI001C05CB13|nr:ABC transporter ATP-binding protein [Brucella sp. NBRC 12950]QWK81764.1 ABC transporter ATP-binding protein [Ochrobactrum sp. BTU1]GLU28131.1 sugar ABC transporter substrate-binding protein [Brucella sp. NBRC 12950]
MTIKAENIVWTIANKTVLDNVSFEAKPGKMVGLLGPNGSGKTSLLRLIAGLKLPKSGRITFDDVDVATVSRRVMAQRVAFVEQHASTNANLKVIDVVKLGRFPHRAMFAAWSEEDQKAVEDALERTGITTKRDSYWQNLSGGEKQRVHIARALAQMPRELILDEPTNHLDIQHQMALLQLISNLSITSIIALHDLNHAAMFCDEIIVLQSGQIVTSGTPDEVITEQLLKEVFCVDARVEASPYSSRPHIHYLRS